MWDLYFIYLRDLGLKRYFLIRMIYLCFRFFGCGFEGKYFIFLLDYAWVLVFGCKYVINYFYLFEEGCFFFCRVFFSKSVGFVFINEGWFLWFLDCDFFIR